MKEVSMTLRVAMGAPSANQDDSGRHNAIWGYWRFFVQELVEFDEQEREEQRMPWECLRR